MFENILDLSLLRELLDWKSVTYILLGGLLLTAFKFVNGLLSGYKLDSELTGRDNKAVAVSLSGYLFSLCIIIQGVLMNPSDFSFYDDEVGAWMLDFRDSCIWAGLGCILLMIARIINNKLILPKFQTKKEIIDDRNIGVGLVQAGSYIATALIIRSNIVGEDGDSLVQEILLAFVWFLITQSMLIAYTYIYQFITKYDLHEELKNNNPAAGVAFAGNMIGFAILMAFYIRSYDSLAGLLVWAATSIILLFIVRLIVDMALLPNSKLDKEISSDRNWGAGTIEAVTMIGSALITTGSLQ